MFNLSQAKKKKMLRRSQVFLKVSPYILFLQDLSKAGKLKGTTPPGKQAAKQYPALSPAAKAALVKRAHATKFSASEAYKRMAKRELAHKDVPIETRLAELKQKWAQAKKHSRKAAKPAAKPKSAKSKVKKAGKRAKKARK